MLKWRKKGSKENSCHLIIQPNKFQQHLKPIVFKWKTFGGSENKLT